MDFLQRGASALQRIGYFDPEIREKKVEIEFFIQ